MLNNCSMQQPLLGGPTASEYLSNIIIFVDRLTIFSREKSRAHEYVGTWAYVEIT
jgi:hypothetical protein